MWTIPNLPRNTSMTVLVSIFLICLPCMIVHCNNARDKAFFLQKSTGEDNKTLLVVTRNQSEGKISAGCEIFTDKKLIDEVLVSSADVHIQNLSDDQMKNVIRVCSLRRGRREVDYEESIDAVQDYGDTDSKELRGDLDVNVQNKRKEQRAKSRDTESLQGDGEEASTAAPTPAPGYDRIPVIFPGTKWCGAGDMAKSYNDLGVHQGTDMCCRAHDFCNDTLAPGEKRHNVTNKSLFTKLSCKCDLDFYDCLDDVNTLTSNTIGNIYFNVLRRSCYKAVYPRKCKKHRKFMLTCLEYVRNTKAPKEYQWIMPKLYKKIPMPFLPNVSLPF